MKSISFLLALFWLLCSISIYGEDKKDTIEVKLNLGKGVVFYMTVCKFNPKDHKINYDKELVPNQYDPESHKMIDKKDSSVISIDGYPYYGDNYKYPINNISKARLEMNGEVSELDTRGIFNVYWAKRINEIDKERIPEIIRLGKYGPDAYYLRLSFGSDGESRLVIWDVRLHSSMRVLFMSFMDYSYYQLEENYFGLKESK